MSGQRGPIVVLGVGNILLRDDGVGVDVVRELDRAARSGDVGLPPGTALIDGGTMGLDLLSVVAGARAIVLVDAVDAGHAPGTVAVIRGDDLRDEETDWPGSRDGVADLLAVARFAGMLPATSVVGIQPAEIDVGLELSDVVRSALPAAVEAAIEEAWRLDAWARPTLDPGARDRIAAGAGA